MTIVKSLLAALALAGVSLGAAAQPIQINIGHALGDTSSYQAAGLHFAELMKQKVGDKVKVTLYPSGGLGGELKLVQGTRTGVVDAMIIAQASLENTVKEYRVLSLPYLFNDYEEANRIMQGPVGDRLLGVLPKYSMVGLGWGAVYARSLASMKPIPDLDAMKGLKVRVIQSPGFVEAYRALGAQPTPTAYAELFLSLQNGVVDAAELSPDQTVADGFAEVIKYYSATAVHQLPSLFIISKAKCDRLPEDVRAAVVEAGRESMKVAVQFQDKKLAEAFDVLKQRGVNVQYPDQAPFRAAARGAWPEIAKAAPGGEQFLAEIEAARAAK